MDAGLHHHPQPPTGLLSGLIELNRLALEASESKVVDCSGHREELPVGGHTPLCSDIVGGTLSWMGQEEE